MTDCDLSGHIMGWPEFDALALRDIDVDALLAFYDRYELQAMRRELETALGLASPGAQRLASLQPAAAIPSTIVRNSASSAGVDGSARQVE